jgi:hypothetical protein
MTRGSSAPLAPPERTADGLPVTTLQREPFVTLPPGRTLGPVSGVSVAGDGHVWLVHIARSPALGAAEEGSRLPPVVELDADGHFLRAWGGPEHLPTEGGRPQWPDREETVRVDSEGMVWIFGSNEGYDHGALRFTPDGELLTKIGRFGETGGDGSRTLLGCPTEVHFDAEHREVFLADGYANHRVVAFDVDTGECTRLWGAAGRDPAAGPPEESFVGPVHCIAQGPDGYLYVCDRMGNRIQVFDAIGKEAKFLHEIVVGPGTVFFGSTFDLAFDPAAPLVYVPDGSNARIWVVDREKVRVIGWFSHDPRSAAENTAAVMRLIHRIAIDHHGHLLVARMFGGLERYHVARGPRAPRA